MPELNLERLAKSLLDLNLVTHVKLNKIGFADVKLLQIYLLQEDVQGTKALWSVSTDELRLEILIKYTEFQIESLSLPLNLLDKCKPIFEDKFDKVQTQYKLCFA